MYSMSHSECYFSLYTKFGTSFRKNVQSNKKMFIFQMLLKRKREVTSFQVMNEHVFSSQLENLKIILVNRRYNVTNVIIIMILIDEM